MRARIRLMGARDHAIVGGIPIIRVRIPIHLQRTT
jgi:hypothetical protein